MVVLSRVALVGMLVGTGCYSPDLRDCTVTCTATSGCASGEVCGSDGYCAAPSVAGMCGSNTGVDAAMARDASTGVTYTLHIMIMGQGKVVLNSTMTCDSTGSQNGDCTYTVPAAKAAQLFAQAESVGHGFMMWTGMGCTGANPLCSLTPTMNVTLGAMFK